MNWRQTITRRIATHGVRSAAPPLTLHSAAAGTVLTNDGPMVNMSSNNYLDLANAPAVRAAVIDAVQQYGLGLASVRFLSGTHDLHLQLERTTGNLLGTEDCIAFGSCFDANAGIFEALLTEEDRIVSDELNHASIIDGVRLSRAKRLRYRHRDLEDLERLLRSDAGTGLTVIVTDGVFSMDGSLAPLSELVRLSREYGAMLIMDDSHGIGALGTSGRGTAEHVGLLGQIDVITGTYGKALGGAMGGFVASSHEIVEVLRARSRPYLFSNPIPACVAAGVLAAIEIMLAEPQRLRKLRESTDYLRTQLSKVGFEVLGGVHPITPIMLRSPERTQSLVAHARKNAVLVSGIQYPVVPLGTERIRLQVNAGHTLEQLSEVVDAFARWPNGAAASTSRMPHPPAADGDRFT